MSGNGFIVGEVLGSLMVKDEGCPDNSTMSTYGSGSLTERPRLTCQNDFALALRNSLTRGGLEKTLISQLLT